MRTQLKRVSAKIFGAALLIFIAALPAAHAAVRATLAQYRHNIRNAILTLDELAALCEQTSADARGAGAPSSAYTDPTPSPPSAAAAEARALSEVRRLLPVITEVERDGRTLEAHNEWLDDALGEYQRISAAAPDNGVRAAAVRRIIERLRALDERLAGAEADAAGEARDKEAEKGRLAAILRGAAFNKQGSKGSALTDLLKLVVQWVRSLIRRLLSYLKPLHPGAGAGVSKAAQILIFALAFVVIAYLIWRYGYKRAGKRRSVTIREARVVLGERLAPEETAARLLAEAERLARAGDMRGAIRKAYVALLCELGDRKIIRLAQHMTNRDYLQAVRQQQQAAPQLFEKMRPLTDNFERHWYGIENATESDWADFRAGCHQILAMK